MKTTYLFLPICITINVADFNNYKSSYVEGGGVNDSNSCSKRDSMKLKIIIGDRVISAILNDNATTRDFVSLLPLTLTLADYSRTEKISDLPKKLSTNDAPAGYKPSVGDITLYSPWGNLAIFYKDFSYSNGLILLGKITSGIEVLNVSGPLKAKFELDNY
jgi:hypothetical protein